MPFFKHIFKKTQVQFRWARRVYLDVASSTPVDRSMQKTFPKIPSSIRGVNPSALHKEGVALRRVIGDARTLVAKTLEVHADEIIFTASATESDNLAVFGVVRHWIKQGVELASIAVMTTSIEHAAVEESAHRLMQDGVRHITLPIDDGVVNPKHIVLPQGITHMLVSVMYVNNEIGTVQPISEIAKRIRKIRKEFPDAVIVFHTDATQAPLHYTLRVPTLGVDMMTLGATKLYTPKGVGVLYKKRNLALVPLLFGGGQEFGLRPGTESVELIHSFAHSLKWASTMREKETERVRLLQQYFETQIRNRFQHIRVTAQLLPRTPHITHLAVKDFDSELLVIELDARGIAVSAKSACKNDLPAPASSLRSEGRLAPVVREQAGEDGESPVVENLYGKGWGAVRFSFGRTTTKRDLDYAVKALASIFQKYKK